jgi:hypothetical protein
MNIFGFDIFSKKEEEKKEEGIVTFVPPHKEDGAIEIDSTNTYLGYSANNEWVMDLDSIPTDEMELTNVYRNMAISPEVDIAIQEIVNEAIITENNNASVSLVLDDVDLSDAIKEKIREEFDHILNLMNFKNLGYGIFRKWYIDGKLIYHKMVNIEKPELGILQLAPIDPLYIKLIREVKRKPGNNVNLDLYDMSDMLEYFIYSQKPFDSDTSKFDKTFAVKIPKDAISYTTSGLMSSDGKIVLSYLYKAIKPYNNLKMLEDATVIYRVARAPERRVFYVDTGSLPQGKADQYVKDVMNRFKSKITYDMTRGSVVNRKNFQSMLEDYWLPRKEGSRGTEVTTLPGGQQLGEMADVEYFKTKLYQSLNVPLSRFQQDSGAMFNIGRSAEITRDEIRFSKFIKRLRNTFSQLFDDLLKTQLILKSIITKDEWYEIRQDINYDFLEDNYFAELKEMEIMQERLQTVQAFQQAEVVGKYISHDTIRRDILKQTDEIIEEEDKKIREEQNNEILNKPEDDGY